MTTEKNAQPEEETQEPLAEVTEFSVPEIVEGGVKIESAEDPRIQPIVDIFQAGADASSRWVDNLEITCQADVEAATLEVSKIKKSSKVIDNFRLWMIEDSMKTVNKGNGLFNPIKKSIDALEKRAKRVIQTWLDEQEEIRQKEQKKLDDAAEKKRKLHATLATKAVQEAAAKQENGEDESATALMEKAQEQLEKAHAVQTDVAAPVAETAAGSHSTGRWVGEITDKRKFIKGLASGAIPWDDALIIIPKGLLNDKARALGTTVDWPGVRFFQEKSLSVKAAE